MTFNEANTVEAFIRDRLAGSTDSPDFAPGLARQGGALSGLVVRGECARCCANAWLGHWREKAKNPDKTVRDSVTTS